MLSVQDFRKLINFYRPFLSQQFTRLKENGEGRILIVQLAGLGDACMLIPFVRRLARMGYVLDLIVPEGLAPLWQAFVHHRKIFSLKEQRIYNGHIDLLKEELQAQNYEAVFVTSVKSLGAFLATIPAAGRRYGMIENNRHYKGSRLFYHKLYSASNDEHVQRRYEGLFRLHFSGFELTELPGQRTNRKGKSSKIVLHPGAKWKPRRWPAERFAELASALAADGRQVHVLMHESDTDLKHVFDPVLTRANFTVQLIPDLPALVEHIRGCELFIGNDSGPAHLSALLGKSTIVLWGPGNDRRIRPLGDHVTLIKKDISCRPCRQYVHPDTCMRGENLCLTRITVDEVLQTVKNTDNGNNVATE